MLVGMARALPTFGPAGVSLSSDGSTSVKSLIGQWGDLQLTWFRRA
jgi:energy-converting hydrogenase Eha subunit H